MPTLLLYPTPRHCTVDGAGCTLADGFGVAGAPPGLVASVPGLGGRDDHAGTVRLVIDPAVVREAGDEAYHLTITTDGVRIAARTATGLRWGLATLVQLRRCCGTGLPGLVIDDAPAFAQRGFMLDIARDRVPSMATLHDLVERMAGLKLNHLQLYNEHAFAYAGHEAVWRAADPITPEEMRSLDAFAATRGVTLTANQNSFGHFERWLRHPAYAHLGETAGPGFFKDWWPVLEPNTLCPLDPGSLALVEDLFTQLFPCCSGPYANIGGDEPWDLGHGRSHEACEQQGRARVFSTYLSAVIRAAQRLGKRPQFWCDPHPNEDDAMPRDLTALVWGYGPQENFATRLAAHATAGREVWVAPGSNNWSTYAGRVAARHGNLTKAAHEGTAHGAVGLLNTEWGDNGHRQQWPLALHGLADGAQASWSGSGTFDAAAAGLHALGSAALGTWLDALGRCENDGLASWSFSDGNMPWCDISGSTNLAGWEEIASRYARLEAELPAGTPLTEECLLAVRMARLAADRAVARRQGSEAERRKAITTRCCTIFADYRRAWLARSRYGGLEDSYAKLNAMTR